MVHDKFLWLLISETNINASLIAEVAITSHNQRGKLMGLVDLHHS